MTYVSGEKIFDIAETCFPPLISSYFPSIGKTYTNTQHNNIDFYEFIRSELVFEMTAP